MNATDDPEPEPVFALAVFQWAPTLGGECYTVVAGDSPQRVLYRFNGHPPLGVNATLYGYLSATDAFTVSMGTHPWG